MDTKTYLMQKLSGLTPYTGPKDTSGRYGGPITGGGGGNLEHFPVIGRPNLEHQPQIRPGVSRYFRQATDSNQFGINPPGSPVAHPRPVVPQTVNDVKNVIDDRLGSRPGDARSALHQLFQNNWTIDDLRNMVLGLRNG